MLRVIVQHEMMLFGQKGTAGQPSVTNGHCLLNHRGSVPQTGLQILEMGRALYLLEMKETGGLSVISSCFTVRRSVWG